MSLILNYPSIEKIVWVSVLPTMHAEEEYEPIHLTIHTRQLLKKINMKLIIIPVMYLEWISHFSDQTELYSEVQKYYQFLTTSVSPHNPF